MEYIFEAEKICKKYKNKKVLNDVSFKLKKGHIYGLIGPNGAGKTTIMRIMAGLTEQSSGNMKFFEKPGDDDNGRKRMSFILETPYMDPNMTAYENMQYIQYVRGVSNKKRIDELLEFVGIADTGKKNAKKFSLGMRQRLGIAMALMPSPEFMVLDEPFNGLDPEGFADLRGILSELVKKNNMTILVSSHILKELSELCTDYIIIRNGQIVETISQEELEEKLRNIFKQEQWIIDGNYQRTLELRLKECDTIFLLDYPTDICIEGAKSRVGIKRDDLPWVEEKLDENFKKIIFDFSKQKLPEIYRLLDKYKDNRNIIVFRTREESDNYIKEHR